MVWEFAEVGTIDFVCPRHGYFKGMRGELKVTAK
jgi:uncharacterized cupredoxin-like copper-binding protein